MSSIVVVGSLNADLVASVDRAPDAGETVEGRSFAVFGGGKGANQAYAAAMLGGSVAMLGRVGRDVYGAQQVEGLQLAGVSTEGVRPLREEPTGTALIIVDAEAENRIVVVPGANGAYTPSEFDQDAGLLDGAQLALFQLEIPLDTVIRGLATAKAAGARTVLDPAPAQALPDEILRHADYITPNLPELRALTGAAVLDTADLETVERAARSLIARGVGKVLAKLGPRGALLVDESDTTHFVGHAVDAVDTTAAGDCFNGAFAVALARGEGEAEAGRFACAAAALAVTRQGAQAGMPSLAEVNRLLKEGAAETGPKQQTG